VIGTDCIGSCNPITILLRPRRSPRKFSTVQFPYTVEYVWNKDNNYIFYRQEATLNKSVGEGKIFYQPDEVDDFDEEDPDDDLDI